jgi:hypothetical protein
MAQLAGCVRDDQQPPLPPGELRVLGQTMHPQVAQRYKQVCWLACMCCISEAADHAMGGGSMHLIKKC